MCCFERMGSESKRAGIQVAVTVSSELRLYRVRCRTVFQTLLNGEMQKTTSANGIADEQYSDSLI